MKSSKLHTKILGAFRIKNLSIFQFSLILFSLVSFITIVLSAVLIVFAETKEFNSQLNYLNQISLSNQKETLRREVDRAIYYLNFLKSDTSLSLEEQQIKALNYLEDIRIGKDGYLFVNTYNGMAKLFDGNIQNALKDISKLSDPNGINFFQKEIELAKLPEGGFFEYHFKKITDSRPMPKISYIRGFDDWKWIIGAGDYLDNINRETVLMQSDSHEYLKTNLLRILSLFLGVLLFTVIMAFFTANLIQNQFNRFVLLFKSKQLSNKETKIGFDSIFIRDLQNIGLEIMEAQSLAKQFGNLVEDSNNEIFIFSQETLRFLHANKGAMENTGYNYEELMQMTPLDLKPKMTEEEFKELIQPLLEKKTHRIFFETLHQRKDKSFYSANVHITTSVFNDQAVFVAFIYDTTEQKETKNQLILSEMRYKELFENAPIALWEEDFTELVIYLRQEIEKHKLPIEELLNQHPEILIKCSDLAKVINLNEQVLKIYKATSKAELFGDLSKVFTENSFHAFKESLLALMRGDSHFQSESVNKTLAGEEINVLLRWTYLPNQFGNEVKVIVSVVDIDELRKTEKELVASEARFRSLFENNHTIMFLINQETDQFIDANPAAVNFYGYSKEQLMSFSVFDLNTLNKEETLLKMQEAQQKGQAFFNFQHRKANGEIRDVEVYSGTLDFEQNQILFSIVHDVTDKKQAEDKIRESKNKIESILRSAPIGIGVVSNRIFTEVNARFCEMTGFSAAELIGKESILIYPSKEEYERVGKEKYDQIKEKGSGTIETQFKRKDGKIINVLMSSTPMDMNDFSKGVTFTALDISDRKKAEAALSHSHDLMRYVIEHNQSDVAIHDRNLNYLYVSKSYLNHYNIKEQDVTGKHHYEVFPDLPQKWRDVHQRALKGEVLSADEDSYEQADGTVDWTHWECRPWFESDGSVGGIILYTEVITKRIQELAEIQKHRNHLEDLVKERTLDLEKNQTALLNLVDDLNLQSLMLETANKRLEEINEELETFTYSVSHDLKAPLRGIDGYSQLLLEEFKTELSPEALSFLRTIRKSAQQMNLLIEDLLAYSRMERKEFNLTSESIYSAVDNIIQLFSKNILEKNIEIKNTIPQNLELFVDKEGFQLIIRNLLDNAIKFSTKTESPQIEIGCSVKTDYTIVFIKDNGIGFDMKYHDRIFKIFQRLHLAEEYNGTGIGLAMVSKAAQRMNAKIWAESEQNKGSCFCLEIKS